MQRRDDAVRSCLVRLPGLGLSRLGPSVGGYQVWIRGEAVVWIVFALVKAFCVVCTGDTV